MVRMTDYLSIFALSFSGEVQILIDKILTWRPNTMEEFTEEQEKYLHAERIKHKISNYMMISKAVSATLLLTFPRTWTRGQLLTLQT